MIDDEPLPPQWLMVVRRNRRRFVLLVLGVFVVFTILSFWALPHLQAVAREVQKEGGGAPLRSHVALLVGLAVWFRVLWFAIAAGCGVAIVLVLIGQLDNFLPFLNFVVSLAGLAAVAFTIYVFFVPFQALLRKMT